MNGQLEGGDAQTTLGLVVDGDEARRLGITDVPQGD